MSILTLDTRILGIGITGQAAQGRVREALNYESPIIAGVTPGKGGMRLFDRIPIYNSVPEAIAQHPELNFLMCYVGIENIPKVFQEALPTRQFKYGWYNAEGAQMLDALKIVKLGEKYNTRIIQGIGMVDPRCRVGIGNLQFENFRYIDQPGINCAVISKSGGYTGDKVKEIRIQTGDGCAFATSISGEKIRGTGFIPFLEDLRHDEGVDYIFIYGEIGGNLEEQACRWLIQEQYEKPVVFDIGGWGTDVCPPGMSLGHADAIIGQKGEGSLETKVEWIRASGSHASFIPSPIALKDAIDQMKKDVKDMDGFRRAKVWDLNAKVVKDYEERHGPLAQDKEVRVIKTFPEKLRKITTVVVQEPHYKRLLQRSEEGTRTTHDVSIRKTQGGKLETFYGGIPVSKLVENSNLAINYAFFIYGIPYTKITKDIAAIVERNYIKIHTNEEFDVAPGSVAERLFAETYSFNTAFSNGIDSMQLSEPRENTRQEYEKDVILREFLEVYESPTGNIETDIENGYILDLIRMVRCEKMAGQILRANREFKEAQDKINGTYSEARLQGLEARMKNPTIEALQFYDIAGRPPSPEQENVYRAFSIASISNGIGPLSSGAALRAYGGSGNKLAAISAAIKTMGKNHGGAGERCVRQLHHYLVQYFQNLKDNKSYIQTLNCRDIEGKPLRIGVKHDQHQHPRTDYDRPNNPLLDLAEAFVMDLEGKTPEAYNSDNIRASGRGHPLFKFYNRDARVTSCDAVLSDASKRDPAYLLNQAIDIAYVLQKIEKYGPDGVERAPVQNVDGGWANILTGHYHMALIDGLSQTQERTEGALDIHYLAAMALFHLPRIAGINSQINYSKGGFELRTPRILIRDLTPEFSPEQIEAAIAN